MKKLTQAGICFLAGWIGVLSAQEKVPADWKLTSLDQIQAKWSSASLGELRAAAEKGDATAQCFLGITLGGMEGHAEDTESHQETIKLLQRAADAGLAAAQVQLAWLYYEGTIDMDVVFGRPDDMHYPSYFVVISTILGKGATPQEGLHWLQRAADQGYAGAQLDLAYIYLNGIGVKKDLAQSVKWKRMAADLGGAQGRFELALSYAQGIGEPRDAEDTPTRLLLKAAAQGHVEAIATMAVRYRTGYAVEQDFIESARLHLQAATKGINKLERFMDRDGTVRAQTDPALKQFAEALKLGMQALDKGDGMAALKLGSSYVEGTRSPKNSERAYAWLNLAAQNGSSEAAGLRDKIKASLGESELKNAEKRFLELKTLALDLGK